MSATGERPALGGRLGGDLAALDDFAYEISRLGNSVQQRINVDESRVEQGLAKVVLALIELIRRLLEKQAVRLIESEPEFLTEEQIERLGEAFLKLDQKMAELKFVFGLKDEDLNLNLGPLGDLM